MVVQALGSSESDPGRVSSMPEIVAASVIGTMIDCMAQQQHWYSTSYFFRALILSLAHLLPSAPTPLGS
jgi:hypothetical protein